MFRESAPDYDPSATEHELYNSIPDVLSVVIEGKSHDFTLIRGNIGLVLTLKYATESSFSTDYEIESAQEALRNSAYVMLDALRQGETVLVPNLDHDRKSVIVMGPFSGLWHVTFSIRHR